jgi:hypothetical protein
VWGQIKDICRNNPRNLDESKINISDITADISPMALQAMSTNTLRRAELYMQHAGTHFQNFM